MEGPARAKADESEASLTLTESSRPESSGSGLLRRADPPWTRPRGIEQVLDAWRGRQAVWENVVCSEARPPTIAHALPLPEQLPAGLRQALTARGVTELYSHQAEAFEVAMRGDDFVVATPTASGKSLCFNLPVLTHLFTEPEARALYLFPTKALSRDQEVSLRELMDESGLRTGAITFDGDTPGDVRRAAKERAGIIFTNPDMLHSGIMPHHTAWARLFSSLRYVIIDEVHAYRGVFGSHLANVLRRLKRIAAFHGSRPQFLCASATIANPQEHAGRLVGRSVHLIGKSGAPTSSTDIVVYNPPVINSELGLRASYLKTAVRLTSDLVAGGVTTLLFGQTRSGVETMLKYLRDRLRQDGLPDEAICAYRGGYLPDARRRIEAGLRSGAIKCVVATQALELGIDIGSLEAVVCAGYPGTLAGLWQRFGRAGRREGRSLKVLVTSSAPLDQYVAMQPGTLLAGAIEEARIDPDNVQIVLQHLRCATFELPFKPPLRYEDLEGDALADALEHLVQEGLVHATAPHAGADAAAHAYHWAQAAYPANDVSLRSAGWDNFAIIDLSQDKTIGELDWHSTHTMLHEQAIYQQEGLQYQVERLDYENHKAYVRPVVPDYYTEAMSHVKVEALETFDAGIIDPGAKVPTLVAVGDVRVIERVVGYKKIKFHTHENVGYGDVDLPEIHKPTTALWITFPAELTRSLDAHRAFVMDALRGLGHALHLVATVGLMIDPRDLGLALEQGDLSATGDALEAFEPTLYLYDQVMGGLGLAEHLFASHGTLLERARRLVGGCSCAEGCPACLGPMLGTPETTTDSEAPLPYPLRRSRKRTVLAVLEQILRPAALAHSPSDISTEASVIGALNPPKGDAAPPEMPR